MTPHLAAGVRSRAPSASLTTPHLSIVIVNYGSWPQTDRLVRQLQAEPELQCGLAEIVIVDNGSPFHPARRRLRRAAGVSLRRFVQNRGFARGANEGGRLSRGQWMLMLNPDTTTTPGFLSRVLHRVAGIEARDPNVGLVGCRLRDPSGAVQGSAGAFPSLLSTLVGLVRPRRLRKCPPRPRLGLTKVSWLSGCGLLVRRDCWSALHGFDPDYFLYYEDVDLCRRARRAGWTVWSDPEIELVHHHPLHERPVPKRLKLLTRHALLTYAKKHWSWLAFRAMVEVVWCEGLVRGSRPQRRMAAAIRAGDHATAYRLVWRSAQTLRRSLLGRYVEHGITAPGQPKPLPR